MKRGPNEVTISRNEMLKLVQVTRYEGLNDLHNLCDNILSKMNFGDIASVVIAIEEQ